MTSATRRTIGVDPKVPVGAIAAVIVWVLAHFAVSIDSATIEAAITLVVSILAAVMAPAANVTLKRDGPAVVESSQRY